MTPAKERIRPIWRGFGKLTHRSGDSDTKQLKTVTVYLRSMNGDQLLGAAGETPDANARKSVEVSGIKAGKITDAEQYAGLVRESVTYDGASEVTGTINDPSLKRTATQHKAVRGKEAYHVRTTTPTHAGTSPAASLHATVRAPSPPRTTTTPWRPPSRTLLIAESLVAPTLDPGCKWTAGEWRSYYDGVMVTVLGGLAVDHTVPLVGAGGLGCVILDCAVAAGPCQRPGCGALPHSGDRAHQSLERRSGTSRVAFAACGRPLHLRHRLGCHQAPLESDPRRHRTRRRGPPCRRMRRLGDGWEVAYEPAP